MSWKDNAVYGPADVDEASHAARSFDPSSPIASRVISCGNLILSARLPTRAGSDPSLLSGIRITAAYGPSTKSTLLGYIQ